MIIFNPDQPGEWPLDTDAEVALVKSAARGNRLAFERLAETYLDGLWRYATRILSNPEDAQDVVQQTLLQAYQSLGGLRQPSRFRAWLFSIARHKCLDQLRRPPVQSFSDWDTKDDDPAHDLPDDAPLPDELLERGETQRLLREAIAALPDQQRQVAALRYAADLSFAEIGTVLGLKENTVKTLFQRAKPQLRFYLRQRL